MPTITNGVVEYEHPHKVGDYVIPKAKVTLSFIVGAEEDAEAALVHVCRHARAYAIGMASGIAVGPLPQPVSITAMLNGEPGIVDLRAKFSHPLAEAAQEAPSSDGAVAAEPAPARRKRASPSSSATQAGSDTSNVAEANPPASHDPLAAAIAASGTSNVVPIGGAPNPVGTANPLHTDKALQDACGAKVGPLTGDARQAMVNKVVELRTEFTGSPALSCPAIPAEKRAEFLARLAAL